jgi:hypothetical protein
MRFERRLDAASHFGNSEWLSKNRFVRRLFAEHLNVGVSAREQDGEIRIVGAHPARKLNSVHSGDQHIRD